MLSGTARELYGVWGSGPTDVFAVGDYGTIIHYNGSIWSTMNSDTSDVLRGVWGSGPGDVFAVGDHGTILHYGSASGSMAGRITYRARANHWSRALLSLRDTSSGAVFTYEVLTNQLGNYTISGLTAGVYHALCYTPTYLKKLVTPVTIPAGGTANVDFLDLKPGDLNDSNAVGFQDIAPFSGSYGSSGDQLP